MSEDEVYFIALGTEHLAGMEFMGVWDGYGARKTKYLLNALLYL